MDDWETRPLEAGFYPVNDGAEVDALRQLSSEAKSNWRASQVQLFSAARRATRLQAPDILYEAHDAHLGALHDWQAAETQYIAARLGLPFQPLGPRETP